LRRIEAGSRSFNPAAAVRAQLLPQARSSRQERTASSAHRFDLVADGPQEGCHLARNRRNDDRFFLPAAVRRR
jgi:hypothetical protein